MLYKSFFSDTILVKTQDLDLYLWLFALLLILSIFSLTALLIIISKLLVSYAKLLTKDHKKLSSKKFINRSFSIN